MLEWAGIYSAISSFLSSQDGLSLAFLSQRLRSVTAKAAFSTLGRDFIERRSLASLTGCGLVVPSRRLASGLPSNPDVGPVKALEIPAQIGEVVDCLFVGDPGQCF